MKFIIENGEDQFRANTHLTKEPRTLEEIDRIPVGAVMYDIGASTGPYAVYAAIRGINVVAFEPRQTALERNAALNNTSLRVFHCALNDTNHRLDDLDIPPPYFVKLDVDGPELQVLQGGKQKIAQAQRVQIEEDAASTDAIQALMHELGFEVEYTVQLKYVTTQWNAVYKK
jgi:predicted RNA methylase